MGEGEGEGECPNHVPLHLHRLPPRGCAAIAASAEETIGFPAYRQAGKVLERGLLGMVNRRLQKMELSQGNGTSESHM